MAKSTLSGYESGNREPTIATIAKVLDILNIDANYLYQDETKALTELVVDLDKKILLKKYSELDNHGKEMVDFTLEKEWERSTAVEKITSFPEVNAANTRTDIKATEAMHQHDDDIMDDENF